MNFDNSFSVAAPIDEVWKAMLDVERVAPCVPGAQVVEQTGENAYKVAIKIKLGPVSMTYKGEVEVVDQDQGAHRATMSAKAKEARGQGTANATVEMRLTQDGEQTRCTIHSDVAISGKAAAMGQGVIGDVSANLIDTFAQNLASMLAGPAAPEPARVQDAVPAPKPASAPDAAEPASANNGPRPVAAATPEGDEGLPIMSLVGSVLAGRMRDPRVATGTLAAIAALFFALGRRSARRVG